MQRCVRPNLLVCFHIKYLRTLTFVIKVSSNYGRVDYSDQPVVFIVNKPQTIGVCNFYEILYYYPGGTKFQWGNTETTMLCTQCHKSVPILIMTSDVVRMDKHKSVNLTDTRLLSKRGTSVDTLLNVTRMQNPKQSTPPKTHSPTHPWLWIGYQVLLGCKTAISQSQR